MFEDVRDSIYITKQIRLLEKSKQRIFDNSTNLQVQNSCKALRHAELGD